MKNHHGELLRSLDLSPESEGVFDGTWKGSGKSLAVTSPIDGTQLATVRSASPEDLESAKAASHEAYLAWRSVPAPRRADVVRALAAELSAKKEPLARLVTLEMGKPIAEARGEVQEMLDICDFAIGQSRQLYGLTMPSERPGHRLQERWHPLGPAAVLTAFNFPVAVWAWNAALALVCGDSVLWKPSSTTPLTAMAVTRIMERVLRSHDAPPGLCSLVVGSGAVVGDPLTSDPRMALVSFTGSVPMGRHVGRIVQERFGRAILELGGNNACIVSDKADLRLALPILYFGAIGTAGQRCTSTRRAIVHRSVHERVVEGLIRLYEGTSIGDPLDESQRMGPLVDGRAVETMQAALETAKAQGGRLLFGGEPLDRPGGAWVRPALVEARNDFPIVQEETFAPILYVMAYDDFDEAIALQNGVPQGLSSAIVTEDLNEAERFLSTLGSDCGIANVNAGTSGAEIGGAFGGEKETGGGRESGSDAWKAYMRRQTQAINYSGAFALAQGIDFDL